MPRDLGVPSKMSARIAKVLKSMPPSQTLILILGFFSTRRNSLLRFTKPRTLLGSLLFQILEVDRPAAVAIAVGSACASARLLSSPIHAASKQRKGRSLGYTYKSTAAVVS